MNLGKIIISLFFSSLLTRSYSQGTVDVGLPKIINYSKTRIPNPNRGFRYEAMVKLPSLQNPWGGPDMVLSSEHWLKNSEKDFDATDGHIRVAQLYIYLTNYSDVPLLPKTALQTIEKLLSDARQQGYTLVLRFAYTYDRPEGYKYPTMARILGHLDQMKDILQKNADVIHVLQAGFIGLWGEWHSDNNMYSLQDKQLLINKILSILPNNMCTQVRLPSYKNKLNIASDKLRRIGFHNDYFTDNVIPYNLSENGFLNNSNSGQVSSQSRYALVDGEMPYSIPYANKQNYILDPIKCLKQLFAHHYTTFSVSHNYEGNIANWKSRFISKKILDENSLPYDPDYFANTNQHSIYDYIADYLGYRLYINFDKSTIVKKNNRLQGSIAITNYGFSSIQTPKELYLVLLNEKKEIQSINKINANLAQWGTGALQKIVVSLPIPTTLKSFKIGIWMPSCNNCASTYRTDFSVRICNTNWLKVAVDKNKQILFNEIYSSY